MPTWSLEKALCVVGSKEKLSEREIFLKSVFLISVASGNRVSELASIDRQSISLTNNRFLLPIASGFLFKIQAMEFSPSAISIPSLVEGPLSLCPVKTLSIYGEFPVG